MPFALALKKTYPNSQITWLVDKKYASLVSTDNTIDLIIEWPRDNWQKLIEEKKFFKFINNILAFFKFLKKTKYDLVIDLQGLLRTNIISRMTNAKKRISLGSEFAGNFFSDQVISRDHKSRRISSEYFALAKFLKLDYGSFKPRFIPPAKTEKSIYKSLNLSAGIVNSHFIILPFTTRVEKHWQNSHWKKLINYLTLKYELHCIVLGNNLDENQLELLTQLGNKVISLAGKTSLLDAAQLINLSKFVVGVDTGLTHMSISLKKNTVALFGDTCPYLNPVNQNSKVIWINKKCSPCKYGYVLNEKYSCLKGIHPDLVIDEINSLVRNNH